MKPAAFVYAKARSLDEAIALLREAPGEARLLAGGQSLMPAAPLIAKAMPHVGHPAIRNRGTVGGSIANADPAAELPACLLAFAFTNDIQGAYVEVDTDTGFVKLVKHWCVEDCGTVINPQLVDEQIRGGIVQGIGAAHYEHCVYDGRGQLVNGTMADYLVPMSAEMPDMKIDHCVSPTKDSELGAKGAGEAGTAGAPGAVMNAINDALRPLGAAPLNAMPFTPDRVLKALGKI
jgi:CO/xanthine dehydrogenase Mo-binding subunit